MKKYSDKEMLALIAKVQDSFTDVLKKAEATAEAKLAKSETKTDEVKKSEENKETETKIEAKVESKEIEELYSSMTKSEAEAHFEAIKKVLDVEEVDGTKMAKSEDEDKLVKSENDKLKSENDELKKSIEKYAEVIKAVTAKFSAPKQKSITNVDFVKKSEDEKASSEKDVSALTHKEVIGVLTEKAKNPSLAKKDQELIVDYCTKRVNVEAIKHLL